MQHAYPKVLHIWDITVVLQLVMELLIFLLYHVQSIPLAVLCKLVTSEQPVAL